MKTKVLFLCTGNSARSQMAEGYLRHVAGEDYEVMSAGTAPVGLNPLAVEVMREIGIDISRQTSKNVSALLGTSIPFVVTVCDGPESPAPFFPAHSGCFTGRSMIPRQWKAPGKKSWPLFASCAMRLPPLLTASFSTNPQFIKAAKQPSGSITRKVRSHERSPEREPGGRYHQRGGFMYSFHNLFYPRKGEEN